MQRSSPPSEPTVAAAEERTAAPASWGSHSTSQACAQARCLAPSLAQAGARSGPTPDTSEVVPPKKVPTPATEIPSAPSDHQAPKSESKQRMRAIAGRPQQVAEARPIPPTNTVPQGPPRGSFALHSHLSLHGRWLVHTNGRFGEAQLRSGSTAGGGYRCPVTPGDTGTRLADLCFSVRPIVIVSAPCAAYMRPEARLSFVLNPASARCTSAPMPATWPSTSRRVETQASAPGRGWRPAQSSRARCSATCCGCCAVSASSWRAAPRNRKPPPRASRAREGR